MKYETLRIQILTLTIFFIQVKKSSQKTIQFLSTKLEQNCLYKAQIGLSSKEIALEDFTSTLLHLLSSIYSTVLSRVGNLDYGNFNLGSVVTYIRGQSHINIRSDGTLARDPIQMGHRRGLVSMLQNEVHFTGKFLMTKKVTQYLINF